MNHHVVTYAGGLDPALDEALRAAIPGADGSGFMAMGAPERDVEFANDWSQEQVEKAARSICGLRFKGAYMLGPDD